MDENKDYTKENRWLKRISIGITLSGFIIIILQMCEFRTQNESLQEQSELLNRSLLQTYRPIGYVSDKNHEPSLDEYNNLQIEWFTNKITLKDSINIYYKPFLVNEGNGVLVYLGHLYYITDTLYSFRERIQKELIDANEIRFDWNYSRSRQESLLPKHFRMMNMINTNLDKKPHYFLYSLILYEDQDGNLYDTETIVYFEVGYDLAKHKLSTTNRHGHDIYSAYSDEEKSILLNLIEKRGHPMVNYFSKNTQAEQKVVKP